MQRDVAAARAILTMEIAYGWIEAAEASMIRSTDSHLRHVGDWHVHPSCPAGHIGEPSDQDMAGRLSELDEIDSQRLATQYLGIIATVGVRGWASPPRLHAWVVSRDERGRPVCEPQHFARVRMHARRDDNRTKRQRVRCRTDTGRHRPYDGCRGWFAHREPARTREPPRS